MEDEPKTLLDRVLALKCEVDCRIAHGAESGGHLEYVYAKLTELVKAAREEANAYKQAHWSTSRT